MKRRRPEREIERQGYRTTIIATLAVALAIFVAPLAASAEDALPSWNEGKAKSDIMVFTDRDTTQDGDGYVALEERNSASFADSLA